MVASSWFAGWHATPDVSPIFGVQNVSWSKYTSVVYSFAISSDDDAHFQLAEPDQPLLKQFVKAAKDNGVEPRLALGGWGGSQFFSYAFAPANRSASVKTILGLASQYGVGGFDFDWEYPNNIGIGCNIFGPDDTTNFLATLQEIRKDPAGANLTLSAAVVSPFRDASANPSTNVSAFADVLDYVEIMNYDIWGNWSDTLGPNAPLNDTCETNPDFQQGSAVTFVDQWVKAGFPKYKIVLGMASYGHTFAVAAKDVKSAQSLTEHPTFDKVASAGPKFGDSWTGQSSTDQCGATVYPGGDMDYWGLMQQGFLSSNGSALEGIEHAFDDCSQTDYVYNPKTGVAVSYDSPRAFTAKGNFIKTAGLRGFSIWEAGGDSGDELLDAVRAATGWEDPDDSGDDQDCQ